MIQVVQAFDRKPIAELPDDDESALERKLSTAARLFGDRRAWLPAHERLAVLQRLVGLMEPRAEHLAQQISQEGGKPLMDAHVEVARAIDGVRHAIDGLRHDGGREIPMGLTDGSEHRHAFTFREPIGVVAAISAFNHPLNLIIHQVIPAVAVGCPVIVKPAGPTPLSCREVVRMLHEAGLPEGWCQMFLPAETWLAERLVTDPRVAFLSFIGSARVGWSLRAKLPPGTRCALEHGGVAPAIIDKSVDLASVIEPLVKGSFYHAGQVCVSTKRIYVHEALWTDFLSAFVDRTKALKVGDPLLPETEVGPLITPREATRVATWLDEASATGATLMGGGRINDSTLRPTVVVKPAADAKVSTLEIFGPAVCLYPYTDIDQAIQSANALPVAFQASVFTTDLDLAWYASERLDASAVMINDHTAFRTDWMPFAGRRESGYGIGGIPYTMRDMTQDKMVVFKRT